MNENMDNLRSKITPEELRKKRFHGVNKSLADTLSRKNEGDGSDNKEDNKSSELMH